MKKVLIMEDEQNIRSFVVINLKRAGYDVIEAGDGQLIWPTAAGRISRGFTGQYPSHNGLHQKSLLPFLANT